MKCGCNAVSIFILREPNEMKPCCLFKNSREIQWAVFRTYYLVIDIYKGFPWWLRGKESTCNTRATGDAGSIPGWDRSPRVGHGNLLQNSCQENPKDRGAWQATVHRVAKSRTRLKKLSMHSHVCTKQNLLLFNFHIQTKG